MNYKVLLFLIFNFTAYAAQEPLFSSENLDKIILEEAQLWLYLGKKTKEEISARMQNEKNKVLLKNYGIIEQVYIELLKKHSVQTPVVQTPVVQTPFDKTAYEKHERDRREHERTVTLRKQEEDMKKKARDYAFVTFCTKYNLENLISDSWWRLHCCGSPIDNTIFNNEFEKTNRLLENYYGQYNCLLDYGPMMKIFFQ